VTGMYGRSAFLLSSSKLLYIQSSYGHKHYCKRIKFRVPIQKCYDIIALLSTALHKSLNWLNLVKKKLRQKKTK
jgi:hypothetical protein